MKKITLILLVLLFAFAGTVYAGDHKAFKGEKLVGFGHLGQEGTPGIPSGCCPPHPPYSKVRTCFKIMNPDSVEEITIRKVLITRRDGTELYEGPFIIKDGRVRTITYELMPLQAENICLHNYYWTGNGDPNDLTDYDNWMFFLDAQNEPLAQYTIEIEWQTKKGVSPLAGWQIKIFTKSEGTLTLPPVEGQEPENLDWSRLGTSRTESPMVNSKQKHR